MILFTFILKLLHLKKKKTSSNLTLASSDLIITWILIILIVIYSNTMNQKRKLSVLFSNIDASSQN